MQTRKNGPVTFDGKSFRVGGERVWLHCAEIHYFRHPRSNWEETLRRARNAGINTISTYVAWNFHELQEGIVDFKEDRDLAHYIDLIDKLGMYAIVRPGPYICSEWDGGGLPAWLFAKPGMVTRDDHDKFMACVQSWFDQVLPILAKRQISQGGPVILVQNENEYPGGWNESTRRYIKNISQMIRSAGIDVPLIGCNAHGLNKTTVQINYSTQPEDQIVEPELIVTYNCGPGAEPLKELKKRQPNAPLLMTEYWAGSQVFWGKQITDWCESSEYARGMLEFASVGCQVVYYMFDGGTNFGYWAGENIVTSYQSQYPVREGGVLWDKYYRLKPVNHFITQFGDFLAESEETPDQMGITASKGVRTTLRTNPNGSILFLTDTENPGTRTFIQVNLPDAETLQVAIPFIRGLALPYRYEVLPRLRIDASNLGLLGKSENTGVVLLWGVAGTQGWIRINGQHFEVTILAGRIAEIKHNEFNILVLDESVAERTWFLGDGQILFGADFADHTAWEHDKGTVIRCSELTTQVKRLNLDGSIETISAPEVPPLPALPQLKPWTKLLATEVNGEDSGWSLLPKGPQSHEELGKMLGYVWYRAVYMAEEEGWLPLFVPHCSTRFLVYANGEYCGTCGELMRYVNYGGYQHPDDARNREQVMVPVRKGLNRIVFLSDHLGRKFHGEIDLQGIRGHVYLGVQRNKLSMSKRILPIPIADEAFKAIYCKGFRESKLLPGIEAEISVPENTDAFLSIPHGLNSVVVTVDEHFVQGLRRAEYPASTVKLPDWVQGKNSVVRIQFEGATHHTSNIVLYMADHKNQLTDWAWKPGGEYPEFTPIESDTGKTTTPLKNEEHNLLVPDRRDQTEAAGETCPSYYITTFLRPEGNQPVFLSIGKLHKGQLFLNGYNLGRYWQVGGYLNANGVQKKYYIPRAWMQDVNMLVVFEEYGLRPEGAGLTWGVTVNSQDYIV